MTELSDETLMAYADRELEPAEQARVCALLLTRPEWLKKVRQFEETRQPVQRAFDTVFNAPASPELLQQIRGLRRCQPLLPTDIARQTSHAAPVTSHRTVTPLNQRGRRGGASWQPMAIAASVCLLLGGAAGWLARAPAGAVQGSASDSLEHSTGLRADAVVRTGLETGVSGVPVTVAASAAQSISFTPLNTFRSRDQRYCRHYQVALGVADLFDGVACRGGTGTWYVQFYAKTDRSTINPGTLTPAAASNGKLIDNAIDRIIDGGVLDPVEEQRALTNRWK